jgi:hypothetical protein
VADRRRAEPNLSPRALDLGAVGGAGRCVALPSQARVMACVTAAAGFPPAPPSLPEPIRRAMLAMIGSHPRNRGFQVDDFSGLSR